RDVPTELARSGNADQCVHISAVDIDLTAHRVDHIAQFSDAFFKDAVSRGIGDHDAGNLLTVGGDFFPQVVEVHVTLAVTGNHTHFEPDHLGCGAVGAVRRGGDQADVPFRLAPAFEVFLDGDQPGVFTLRASIRLQADSIIAGTG